MAHNRLEASNTAHSAQGTGQSTLLTTCIHCRRRKVRCNKTLPCDNCVRLGFQCAFPAPGRKPRRKVQSSKADLVSRLRLLEQQVEQLNAENFSNAVGDQESPDSNRATNSSSSRNRPISSNNDTEESKAEISEAADLANGYPLERQNGRLLIDRRKGTSQYVNHRVLTEMGDQVTMLPCVT